MIKEIKNNTLYFDGVNTVELAKQYGTPLYVYSITDIKSRIAELKEAFLDKYENTRVAYAGKAFLNLALIKLIEKEGLCLDVVSGGELLTALKASFPPERIEMNGNNKLEWEIKLAVEENVGRIIIDGEDELEIISKYAKEAGKKVSVLFRITPGISASSHDYIITGKKDSKFGFPISEDGIYRVFEKALQYKELDILGFHFHIGSQLFENDIYVKALNMLYEISLNLNERHDFIPKELNIGGGFGINYLSTDERKPYSFFFEPVMESINSFFSKEKMPRPHIVTEPGRSIVGEAGITLYTVGNIKNIEGIRKYVSVDGGMADNIRPALYEAKYEGIIANKADENEKEKITVCGKCCESGDILAKDVIFQRVEKGDILALFSTGAYGHSMASNYNKLPIPAIVFCEKGKSYLVTKRQSYEDLNKNDLIPKELI